MILAAALVMTLAAAAQDVELPSSFHPVRHGDKLLVKLEGRTSLPDDACLQITLVRLDERCVGTKLESFPNSSGIAEAPVSQKRFAAEISAEGGGLYKAILELRDEAQLDEIRPKIQAQGDRRRWEFVLHGWNDDLLASLPALLTSVDAAVLDMGRLVDEVEQACASAEAWKTDSGRVIKEGETLLRRLQAAPWRTLYPATQGELVSIASNLLATTQFMKWSDDGSLQEFHDYHTGGKAKTFKHEDFSFAAVRRYVEEAKRIAGRESGLWLVKEFHRILPLRERAAASAATAGRVIAEIGEHAGFREAAGVLDGLFEGLVANPPVRGAEELSQAAEELERKLRSGRP
ncbi:MAG: hypothetical protein HYY16_05230 [Planctomycetes bacterium]|nr:hypothetical protein [Planctomycetota bacterium]